MHLLRPLSRRLLTLSRPTPFQLPKSHLARQPILLPLYKFQEPVLFSTIRWASSITTTPTLSPDGLQNNRDHSPSPSPTISESDTSLLSSLPPSPPGREDVPSYAMVFTCKKCDARSAHRVSKQGYHHGTVLITCPSCKNKHLMADHLKVYYPIIESTSANIV